MSGHDLGKIEYAPPLDKVPHSNKCRSLHLNLKKSAPGANSRISCVCFQIIICVIWLSQVVYGRVLSDGTSLDYRMNGNAIYFIGI